MPQLSGTPVWQQYVRRGRLYGAYFYAESACGLYARCVYARGVIDDDERWSAIKRPGDVRHEILHTTAGMALCWEPEPVEARLVRAAKLPHVHDCMLNGKPALLTAYGYGQLVA